MGSIAYGPLRLVRMRRLAWEHEAYGKLERPYFFFFAWLAAGCSKALFSDVAVGGAIFTVPGVVEELLGEEEGKEIICRHGGMLNTWRTPVSVSSVRLAEDTANAGQGPAIALHLDFFPAQVQNPDLDIDISEETSAKPFPTLYWPTTQSILHKDLLLLFTAPSRARQTQRHARGILEIQHCPSLTALRSRTRGRSCEFQGTGR